MRRRIQTALIAALLAGCAAGSDDTGATRADTLTRAQRDSIVGASSLPGAGAVRKALDASDAAAARAARLDSMLQK